MKRNTINKAGILVLLLLLGRSVPLAAQEADKGAVTITLRYVLYNNQLPCLKAQCKTKVQRKFLPVTDLDLSLYLDTTAENHLIGKVKTDEKGEAQALIPPSLKALWNAAPNHKFIGVSAETKEFDASDTDLDIAKARITLDTLSDEDTKSIRVTVQQWKDSSWVDAPEVEVKVGVSRLGGFLPVDKAEDYTTDSLGQATADFTIDSLPGDAKGNVTLVAIVEDNDQFGTLVIEKEVPWGVSPAVSAMIDFNRRTLWATREKAPYWLLFMAYSITFSVWGVLLYLIVQLRRISRLGR